MSLFCKTTEQIKLSNRDDVQRRHNPIAKCFVQDVRRRDALRSTNTLMMVNVEHQRGKPHAVQQIAVKIAVGNCAGCVDGGSAELIPLSTRIGRSALCRNTFRVQFSSCAEEESVLAMA
jgi:hypothetical protein